MYGVEIWGWKEWEELEKIQDTYMKWTLKTEGTTPRHILLDETGRYQMEVRAGGRAVKYERKLAHAEQDTLRKECWKVIKREKGKTDREKRRKEYFERRGWGSKQEDRRRGRD